MLPLTVLKLRLLWPHWRLNGRLLVALKPIVLLIMFNVHTASQSTLDGGIGYPQTQGTSLECESGVRWERGWDVCH